LTPPINPSRRSATTFLVASYSRISPWTIAGLAILSEILDVPAARLLALMLLVFSALTLVPMIFAFPHRHDVWAGNAYELAAAAAAWILAESLASRDTELRHDTRARLAHV